MKKQSMNLEEYLDERVGPESVRFRRMSEGNKMWHRRLLALAMLALLAIPVVLLFAQSAQGFSVIVSALAFFGFSTLGMLAIFDFSRKSEMYGSRAAYLEGELAKIRASGNVSAAEFHEFVTGFERDSVRFNASMRCF